MSGQRIGIMGGTFDPIHFGHLVAAEAAREQCCLKEVVFVPSGRPPHKAPDDVTDFWRRCQMVVLATATNPFFKVSSLEYERGGCSYTVDTVQAFSRSYGAGTDLFFITGADAIMEILGWKHPEELLARCRFIAVTRPGYDLQRLNEWLSDFQRSEAKTEARDIKAKLSESVSILEIPMLNISSSNIRERLRRGASIKYLVPEAVEAYIIKNGLYRQQVMSNE